MTLPPGQDPADAPDGFEQRLGQAESYLHYRVRLELDRASDRQEGVRARPRDPRRRPRTRPSARRRCGSSPTGSTCRARRSPESRRPAEPRAERPTRASRRSSSTRASGSSARRSRLSSPIPSSSTRSQGSRRSTSSSRSTGGCAPSLVARRPPDADLVPLLAELDATPRPRGSRGRPAPRCCFGCASGSCRRDLQGETDLARATELQAHLAKVRQALTELS